jgi:hypothetical protein
MKAVRKYGQMNFSGHTPGAYRSRFQPLHHVIDPAHTLFGQHDVRSLDRERLVRALCDPRVQQHGRRHGHPRVPHVPRGRGL